MLNRVPPPFAVSAQGASASSGTVVFSNSNGVTFGQNGNTVTASVSDVKFSAGVSNLGNTAGNTGVTGTRLVLVGTNNITLSQGTDANGATVSISGGAGAAGNTGYVSAGGATASLGTVVFSNSNGVSFGVNGQTVTGSVAAQSNQSAGWYAVGNTTQNSSTTLDARTLSVGGRGDITVGYSNGTIQISGSQTNQSAVKAFGASNTGNTAGNTGVSTGIDWVLAGTNGVTISESTAGGGPNTLWVSGVTTAAQTNQSVGLYAVGNTTQNSSTTLDARTLSFGGRGDITVGYSNGTVQVSGNQTNQTLGLYAVSNTTQSTSGTADARTLSFAGAGIASVGVTNGSVVVSVPSGGGAGDGGVFAGVSTMGNTAGSTGTVSTGNFVLVGTNALTLSQSTGAAGSAATITLSVPPTSSLSATGWASISTNGSTVSLGASYTGNVYAAGNTFGTSSGTADPQTLSVRGSGGVSVAASNSGWVVSAVPQATISFFENGIDGLGASQTQNVAPGSVSVVALFQLPQWGSFSFLRVPIALTTGSTTLSTSAAAANMSAEVYSTWNAVVYSLGTGANSRSLQSVASGSAGATVRNSISVAANGTQGSYTQAYSYAVEGNTSSTSTQYSISNTNYSWVSTNWQSLYTGSRFLDVNFANSLTPGPYWLVFGLSTSSASNSARVSAATNCNVGYATHYGNSQANLAFGVAGSTNLTSGAMLGAGSFSTAGGGTTASLPVSAISSSASHVSPYFQLIRSA